MKEERTDKEQLDFISKVLSIRDGFQNPYADLWDAIYWRTDEEFAPVTFWVNCNDLFWWATADNEEITPENFHLLKEAVNDVASALGAADPSYDKKLSIEEWKVAFDLWRKVGSYAADLFCARSRKMRPQHPCYKIYPQILHPLFDVCGPKRDPKEEG
jgi:hypothetical protein